jgi:hypothetical protein
MIQGLLNLGEFSRKSEALLLWILLSSLHLLKGERNWESQYMNLDVG